MVSSNFGDIIEMNGNLVLMKGEDENEITHVKQNNREMFYVMYLLLNMNTVWLDLNSFASTREGCQ